MTVEALATCAATSGHGAGGASVIVQVHAGGFD